MNRGNLLRYGVKVLLLIRQTYTDVNKYFMWTSKLPVINQFQFEAATIPKSTIKNNQDYRTMAVDSSRTCLTKSCDFYPSIWRLSCFMTPWRGLIIILKNSKYINPKETVNVNKWTPRVWQRIQTQELSYTNKSMTSYRMFAHSFCLFG